MLPVLPELLEKVTACDELHDLFTALSQASPRVLAERPFENYIPVIPDDRPLTVTPPGDDDRHLAANPLPRTGRSSSREHRLKGEATKGSAVEREKALEMAMAQIEKQHGKGAVMKMSDKGEMTVEAIPTGALALDLALGVGGLPRGRVVE